MHALLISFVTFFFTFSASRIGPLIHAKLPSSDTAKESQDVVRLGMGLVATMTALLLGLVTAAAKGSFDTQDAAIKTSAANILTLDRHLAHFGAEAQPIRDLLRRALEYRIAMMWPSGQTSRASLDVPQNVSAAEEVQNRILALHAETEAQRWHKGQALALTEDVVRTRFLVLGSSRGAVSEAFLVVVIFWLTATFASFGLYAPRNTTVTTVLFIAALSVAAAVFLILELDGPFTGVIRISSAPLRYALDQIGK